MLRSSPATRSLLAGGWQGSGYNASLVRLFNAFCTSETATITLLTFDRLSDLNYAKPILARDLFLRIMRNFINELDHQMVQVG